MLPMVLVRATLMQCQLLTAMLTMVTVVLIPATLMAATPMTTTATLMTVIVVGTSPILSFRMTLQIQNLTMRHLELHSNILFR